MKIIRSKKEGNFVQILNEVARDGRISYRALGVLVRELSNADGFRMDSIDLASEGEGREGRDAVRIALNELKKYGYRRDVKTSKAGKFSTEIHIYDAIQPVENAVRKDKKEKKESAARARASKVKQQPQPQPQQQDDEFGDYSCELIIKTENTGEFKLGKDLMQKLEETCPGIEDLQLFLGRIAIEFISTGKRNKVAKGQWKLSAWVQWRCEEEQNYLGDVWCFGKEYADSIRYEH